MLADASPLQPPPPGREQAMLDPAYPAMPSRNATVISRLDHCVNINDHPQFSFGEDPSQLVVFSMTRTRQSPGCSGANSQDSLGRIAGESVAATLATHFGSERHREVTQLADQSRAR
jgi:hypothetical protein